MPIEKGGREPKLTSTAEPAARVVGNHRGGARPESGRPLPGKTSSSPELALYLTEHYLRTDRRILIFDVDSTRSAAPLADLPQDYTPLFIDSPASSPFPVGGQVWADALDALGLAKGSDDHTR